jgi:MFS transporter, DHA2 family, multidrug resistance protein
MGDTATRAGLVMAPVGHGVLLHPAAGRLIFSGLKPEQLPSAAGLSNFARITAGAVGTSLFTTLWENRAVMHHAHLSEAVNAGNGAAVQALAQFAAAGQSPEQANATLSRLIDQQAFTMAAADAFYLSAGLFVLLVGVVWFASPRRASGGDMAGGGGAH